MMTKITGTRATRTFTLILAILLVIPAWTVRAAPCFTSTGQCTGDPFGTYWQSNGGLPVFGFPVTTMTPETILDITVRDIIVSPVIRLVKMIGWSKPAGFRQKGLVDDRRVSRQYNRDGTVPSENSAFDDTLGLL